MNAVIRNLLLLVSVGAAAHAVAQNYPNRAIRIIVPGAVGTPADIGVRGTVQAVGPSLGQPFVVDNRAGANGIIGMEACAKAAPDGYTLCGVHNTPISINPFVYAKLPYDPPRDFAPVIQIGVVNTALAINASMPVNSLRQLIDYAKSKPGALNWATWGSGSPSHLYLSWLQSEAGVSFTHVPYKTPDQALTAVLTGEAHAIHNAPGTLQQHVKAGKMKALAITGDQRSRLLPETSTYKEQGFNLQYRGWNGIFAPIATPREIIQKLNAEFGKVIADEKFARQVLAPIGMEATGGSPEEFAAFLKTDREVGAVLVKVANLKAE